MATEFKIVENKLISCISDDEIIEIPDNVSHIKENALSDFCKMTTLVIPKSVEVIETPCFTNCRFLENIIVDESNPFFSHIDGTLYNKEKNELIRRPCGKTGAVHIPRGVEIIAPFAFIGNINLIAITFSETVKKIGRQAFENCRNLTYINLNDTLETISAASFRHCNNIKKIHIPAGVKNLDSTCFYDCEKLTSITIAKENEHYHVDDNIIYSNNPKKLLRCPLNKKGDIIVSQGTEEISTFAFSECREIKSIQLPDTLKSIKPGAFSSCGDLTCINLPEGITKIENSSFSFCTKLREIHIPEGVVSIGEHAFFWCSELQTVTIPSTVKEIGEKAFADANKIEKIVIPEATTKIGKFAVTQCKTLINNSNSPILHNITSTCKLLTDGFLPNETPDLLQKRKNLYWQGYF